MDSPEVWAAIIAASGAVVVAAISTYVPIRRNRKITTEVAHTVGRVNGRGNLVAMVERIDERTEHLVRRDTERERDIRELRDDQRELRKILEGSKIYRP